MRKKLLMSVLSLALAVCTLFSFTACGGPSKEDIAYDVVCAVAYDNNLDSSDVVVLSGSIEKDEETADYNIWMKVTVYGYITYYFTGTYYVEDNMVEYTNVTSMVNNSIVGPGPLFLSTSSFDVSKVNEMLKGE